MIEGGSVTKIAFGLIILMFLVVGTGLLIYFGQEELFGTPFLSATVEVRPDVGKAVPVANKTPGLSTKELLGFIDYPVVKLPQPLPNSFSAVSDKL